MVSRKEKIPCCLYSCLQSSAPQIATCATSPKNSQHLLHNLRPRSVQFFGEEIILSHELSCTHSLKTFNALRPISISASPSKPQVFKVPPRQFSQSLSDSLEKVNFHSGDSRGNAFMHALSAIREMGTAGMGWGLRWRVSFLYRVSHLLVDWVW